MPIPACVLIALLLAALPALPATGDEWVEPPPGSTAIGGKALSVVRPAEFYAEVALDELNVYLRSKEADQVTLFYSYDAPGHWPSRDWRSKTMRHRESLWDAQIPVSELTVPIVYFAKIRGSTSVMTAMRVIQPQTAGMRKPSELFWPYLEGFEEPGPWEIVGAVGEVDRVQPGFSGDSALRVSIPKDKRSATISTTRIRAWHFTARNADGIRLRANAPKRGRLRLTLITNSGTSTQSSMTSTAELKGTDWELVHFPARSFKNRSLAGVDRATIEFVSEGPSEIHLDDLELTGPWRVRGLRR
ncbi:MAG: hypothetical protein CMO80_07195 [Verrucomicrobiales bacterium]|nr:hypothetical protein [Verrucomicrobiales bacterium]|tara:strand:- start:13256 stop:14161 length:906 start_codon:yes stop_codon:yes gene_type:complete